MAQITVPIEFDHEDLKRIVEERVAEIKEQFYLKKDVDEAIAEIEAERDKSYEGEAVCHGWGMQSALEILRRHLEDGKD